MAVTHVYANTKIEGALDAILYICWAFLCLSVVSFHAGHAFNGSAKHNCQLNWSQAKTWRTHTHGGRDTTATNQISCDKTEWMTTVNREKKNICLCRWV